MRDTLIPLCSLALCFLAVDAVRGDEVPASLIQPQTEPSWLASTDAADSASQGTLFRWNNVIE